MSEIIEHVSGAAMSREPKILYESIDERGFILRYVHVDDISEQSPTREQMQSQIAAYDELLRENPGWLPPETGERGELIVNNPVSAWVYSSPAMHAWRQGLVPTAEALLPMQKTYERTLPIRLRVEENGESRIIAGGEMVDDAARSFFVDALDSIGIRSRAAIMASIARCHIEEDDTVQWMSLACGAAHPVLEALESVSLGDNGQAYLHLIDYDQGTLESAKQQAALHSLTEGEQYETRNRNLVTDMIISDKLVQEYSPESARLVDALGIFEYFNDKRSVEFLRNVYRLVEPGGAAVIANMLSTRKEIDFNQRGIGWPKIFPRTIDEMADIIEAAGIPMEAVTITIPEDGVYAVAEIRK